jgi:alpha-glucosidase (family GH31 glycosyl hydrolase)
MHDNFVNIQLSGCDLTLSFPTSGGLRLKYGPEEPEPLWCPILTQEPLTVPCTVNFREDSLYVTGGNLTVLIGNDASLSIFMDDRKLWNTPAWPFTAENGCKRLAFCAEENEHIYGLGQDPMGRLDQNGYERRMWNQWGGHERSGNCGIGFFTSSAGYGMMLNSTAAARFCFGKSTPAPLDPLGEAMVPSPFEPAHPLADGTSMIEVYGPLDIFVLFGSRSELLTQYYSLTGFPGLLPKWAYGFLQCKNRYMNRDDLLATARRIRESNIPCDGLIIDWLWFSEFGDLEWNENDWPDPAQMLKQLASDGFHVSSAQHPFISEKCKYFGLYSEKGYLNKVPPQKRITYDHTNPDARRYWWEKTSRLYRQGIRGYWTDMGELEEHFEDTGSYAGGRLKTHNAYSLLWAKGLYEGQRSEFLTRAFILSRSGCAGIQKYGAALWSGDINSTWQVLRDQVVIGQGMAMSGIPWWCTDIGGFLSGEECTPELYIRWMEWGVFCALFRTHGTRPGNEPWSFGSGAQKHIEELIRLRYRFLPYVYSLAMDCALHGTSMIRPMAWEYPDDKIAVSCEGQFFLGSSLLVAPVTKKGARSWRVYLPAGTWRHWWSGRIYNGGWHTVPAPLGQIPFFVREGSIIPLYESIGRNAEECGNLMLIAVGDDGTFDYYDDAGDGFGYEKGEYTQVRFRNRNGRVSAETLKGKIPEYTVHSFSPQASDASYAVDCQWRGERAEITLTFLKESAYSARLEPESGWQVIVCTAGGAHAGDIFEQAYYQDWEGPINGKPGETVSWQLVHTACSFRVGVQQANLRLTTAHGNEETTIVEWDGAYLSSPAILGCFAPSAAAVPGMEYPPEHDPKAPFYELDGKIYHWHRDASFARNPYGYVDFRRLGTYRDGETMRGTAYAKEILYSKMACEISFLLRHDSPIDIWLNGEKVYSSMKHNAQNIKITFPLIAGQNILLIKQTAEIARPYSGGEFGYSLEQVCGSAIYSIK